MNVPAAELDVMVSGYAALRESLDALVFAVGWLRPHHWPMEHLDEPEAKALYEAYVTGGKMLATYPLRRLQ